MKKLTDRQQGLYEAMKNGAICYYMPYMGRFNENAYYFRDDNHARCTAQVKALLSHGLVEIYDQNWRGHKVRKKCMPEPPQKQPREI